jgi:hypothetical protein
MKKCRIFLYFLNQIYFLYSQGHRVIISKRPKLVLCLAPPTFLLVVYFMAIASQRWTYALTNPRYLCHYFTVERKVRIAGNLYTVRKCGIINVVCIYTLAERFRTSLIQILTIPSGRGMTLLRLAFAICTQPTVHPRQAHQARQVNQARQVHQARQSH